MDRNAKQQNASLHKINNMSLILLKITTIS